MKNEEPELQRFTDPETKYLVSTEIKRISLPLEVQPVEMAVGRHLQSFIIETNKERVTRRMTLNANEVYQPQHFQSKSVGPTKRIPNIDSK